VARTQSKKQHHGFYDTSVCAVDPHHVYDNLGEMGELMQTVADATIEEDLELQEWVQLHRHHRLGMPK